MNDRSMSDPGSRLLLWVFLFLGTMLGLMLLVPYDRQLTLWLGQLNAFQAPARSFDQSLFEGEAFGFSDGPIIGYLIALGLLLFLWRRRRYCQRCSAIFNAAGFICYSGLVIALAFVHPMKKIWSRPRPYQVFGPAELPYFDWYQPASVKLADLHVSGSLPSGHTATFLFFVALTYALRPALADSLWVRRLVIGMSLFACLLMGLSRSVVQAHWVSDWLLTISVGCLIIDVLYFKVWASTYRSQTDVTDALEYTGARRRRLLLLFHYLRYPVIILGLIVGAKMLAMYI